jgi:4'-phosphopantetheinyl transferase
MSIRKMASSDLVVWMTRTDPACEPRLLARYVALLSEPEREHWAAFRSESARNDFVAGRALVRCALSHVNEDFAPQRWQFTANAFGRPELVPEQNPRDLRFNLSHTRGLIACVVATGRDVGIDVEWIDRPTPVVALAQRFLSASDAAEVLSTPCSHQQARFFELWTRRESYVKALGLGLDTPLATDDANRWRSWLWQPTPSHVLALTAELSLRESASLHLHDVVPLAA